MPIFSIRLQVKYSFRVFFPNFYFNNWWAKMRNGCDQWEEASIIQMLSHFSPFFLWLSQEIHSYAQLEVMYTSNKREIANIFAIFQYLTWIHLISKGLQIELVELSDLIEIFSLYYRPGPTVGTRVFVFFWLIWVMRGPGPRGRMGNRL